MNIILTGTAYTDWMEPVDGTGAPISGITATLTANLVTEDPAHASFTATITEEGSLGRYAITFTPATDGTYFWRTKYTAPLQIFSETYLAQTTDSTAAIIVVTTSATGALSLALSELRRRVADRFGDYVFLTATDNGTTTTLVDVLNVNSGAEHYNGRYLYFVDGSNAERTARVTSTTDSSGTLTFTPAVAASTLNGDTCDVFNKRGIGFSPAEYKRAINNAINDAYPLGFIEITAEIVGAFDSASPEITVPAAFTDVHSVEWQDIDDLWHSIPQATKTNEWGWFPDAASGEIRIQGRYALDVDGFTIRLTGYGRQDTLDDDTDTCSLNAEYIVSRAAYHLAAGSLMRDPTFAQLAQLFQGESERMRTRVRTVRKAETRKVRAA